jgi:diguanylate cyclase (GGDEF)-like protein
MDARSRTGRLATDGHLQEPAESRTLAFARRLPARGAAWLLAAASIAAALTMAADGVPLVVRLAVVAAVALLIGLVVVARSAPLTGVPARTDALTGLPDELAFERLLAVELERARAAERTLALVLADVDALRAHEEWFGREARDRALRLVARDLEKWKRRIDVAGYMGGGEFALLVPGTDACGALLVAERMRRGAHRTFVGEPSRPTLSLGIALYPDHGGDASELVDAARQALATAKELGGDRSALYSSEVESVLHSAGSEAGTRALRLATVLALAEALDLRDFGGTEHAHTVAHYAELTALELGCSRERSERVQLAGMLHDIGMIGVPAELLQRSEPPDEIGWTQIHTHPELAAHLLAGEELADLRAWIEAHHERPDGKGYPRGLAGDEIPLEGRILAVADAYEAMTAERPYRAALGERVARAELLAHAGTQFDGAVVTPCCGRSSASRRRPRVAARRRLRHHWAVAWRSAPTFERDRFFLSIHQSADLCKTRNGSID